VTPKGDLLFSSDISIPLQEGGGENRRNINNSL